MYEDLDNYLSFAGKKYIKPEKAGELAEDMLVFKESGQAARKAFTEIAKALAPKVAPFEMVRVSNWANQAQTGRPHFWCYYQRPDRGLDSPALAIRLYGDTGDFGISVEVSFVERKKTEATSAQQHKVLNVPIAAPLYYLVQQQDGESHSVVGTEENRLRLQTGVKQGCVRKVLVKCDVPMQDNFSLEGLTKSLADAFKLLKPYYEAANN